MQDHIGKWLFFSALITHVMGLQLLPVDASGFDDINFDINSASSSANPRRLSSASSQGLATLLASEQPTERVLVRPIVKSEKVDVPVELPVQENFYQNSTVNQAPGTIPLISAVATKALPLSYPDYSDQNKICKSTSCKYFAQTFLSHFEGGSGYCDDFYDFINRKSYLKQNEQTNRLEEEAESFHSVAQSNLMRNIYLLLSTNPTLEPNTSKNLIRLNNFYASCMNGVVTISSIVDLIRKLGGFPMGSTKSGWDEQVPFDWIETTIKFRQLGLNLEQFFEFGAEPDRNYYRLKIGMINQESLDNTMNALDIATTLFPPDEAPSPSDLAMFSYWKHQVDQIGEQFEELKEFRSDLRENFHRDTLKKLQSKIPDIDWFKLLLGITSNKDKFMKSPILIHDFAKLESIVKLIARADPKVLANHMILNIIDHFGPYLRTSSPTLSSLSEFYNSVDCVEVVMKNLGLALSVEYSRNYIKQDSMDPAKAIIRYIRKELKLMTDEADWILDKTQVSRRIRDINFTIGFSFKKRKPINDEWFYKGLKVDPLNFFDNLMTIKAAKHEIYLNDLISQESSSFYWTGYDLESMDNAELHHDALNTRIRVPIRYLDRIYVDRSRLSSINFATFGTKIAHKMILALGLRRIAQKSMETRSDAALIYLNKLDCLRFQYNGLWVEGSTWLLDGDATLMENMADNAGVEVAYRAFLRYIEGKSGQELLRNVPLDSRQLFWASYTVAQYRPFKNQHQIDVYRYGPESLPKYRVNIPLGNHESFSKDFKCPRNTVMNPVHRCTIWS